MSENITLILMAFGSNKKNNRRIEKIEKIVIKTINILIKNNLINDAFLIKENYPLKTQNDLLSIIIKRIIFDRKASHLNIFLSQSK